MEEREGKGYRRNGAVRSSEYAFHITWKISEWE